MESFSLYGGWVFLAVILFVLPALVVARDEWQYRKEKARRIAEEQRMARYIFGEDEELTRLTQRFRCHVKPRPAPEQFRPSRRVDGEA